MKLKYRLIFLLLFLCLLTIIGFSINKDFSFLIDDFWFASGLLLLILMTLIDQPFFSTEANIFMNGTAGLSLILVNQGNRDFWWWIFLGWCIWLIFSSFILMWLFSNKQKENYPFFNLLSKLNREIGKPTALYSSFFLWGVIRQYGLDSNKIDPLFAFWGIFIIFNIPSISRAIGKYIDSLINKVPDIEIAELFRVLDPRVIEVKFKKECPNKIIGKKIKLTNTSNDNIAEAIVIDDRIITGNRLGKLALTNITSHWNYISSNPEKLNFSFEPETLEIEDDLLISVVDNGSSLNILKFYVHPDTPLKKGEVVWTELANGNKVYYQIILAIVTDQQTIEGNITRSILVTANQLGIWKERELKFEQFSWIPPVGELIYKVIPKPNQSKATLDNYISVGIIPNSNFPVFANISELVTHNTAIIGITGSGKSYFSFHLIESYIQKNIKVLILDLTREYYSYLEKFKPTCLTDANEISNWYESDSLIAIHQFANSTNYTKTTADFISSAFEKVKEKMKLKPGIVNSAKLCIIFEEAHTLIPEWQQVAEKNDSINVNRTARTILQGRKFGMGSLIITQRTANVTKTILNQCNTIIAMRSFDKTGLDFLGNYMGHDYSQAISTLPNRDAIIVGKSSSCHSPIIFTIPDFSDRWNNEEI